MKRILLMVFRNLFFVPYGWFKLCWYASHAERYSEEQRYQLLKYVDNRAVKGGNLVIDGHGMENIPKENGFMFFPNHQGLFDCNHTGVSGTFLGSGKKRADKRTISEAGICMHESVYD